VTDRPRALAVLIAVFLLGCILGSAGSYMYLRNRPDQPFVRGMQGGRPGPERGQGTGRQGFSDMLQLTPEQEGQFREIMAESRKQLDALRMEQGPKIEAIRTETNRKLMSVLNEEQKRKFSAFLEDMAKRRPPRMGGRGMEPPPPREP